MDFNEVLGWKAEGMRFSLFTATPNDAQPDWWSEFVGQPHETSTTKAATGEFVYVGDYDSGLLELRILPDRIDWIFKPNVEVSPFFPTVGEFNSQLSKFKESFEIWVSQHPGIYTRVAFATTLMHQVNGREDGYGVINKFLPFLPLKEGGWQDFYLQFNKTDSIPSDGGLSVGINRLVNYSIAHVQMLTFNGNMTPVSHYFARLELDINTQVENNHKFNVEGVLAILGGLTDIPKTLKDLSEV